MSVLTIADFRTFGPGAAVVDVADQVIQFWIDAAEKTAAGTIGKRGYDALLDTAAEDFKGAIIKIVTWNVMRLVRGVSPMDPAHDALRAAHDEALEWFASVRDGANNLVTPTRRRTAVAGVWAGTEDGEDRGW